MTVKRTHPRAFDIFYRAFPNPEFQPLRLSFVAE
jgi:hypothetical protein